MARENIPSISVTYKDGGLAVPVVETTTTDTILVIGMAVDGPVGEPVSINASSAEYLFGPLVYDAYYKAPTGGTATSGDYNGNTLIKGMYEAVMGGCANIKMMRVGGTLATATPTGSAPFYVTGKYPGDVYNGLQVQFTSGTATMTVYQSGIGKGYTLNYTTSGQTVAQLMNTVNNDLQNRSMRIAVSSSSALTTTIVPSALNGTYALTGGANGTLGSGMADLLTYRNALSDTTTGAFTLLQDIDCDIVYLTGIYLDDDIGSNQTQSVATDLASACFLAAINSYPKVAVMGLRPTMSVDRASIEARVQNMISSTKGAADAGRKTMKSGYFLASPDASTGSQFWAIDPRTGAKVDTGRYIQVVAGPDVMLSQKQLGAYLESPAGLYAGFVSTLEPQRAATNKNIPGIEGMPYEFTIRQINMLAGGQPYGLNPAMPASGPGGAYVVLRRNPAGSIIVNLDNTAAMRKSDYAKLQVMRIVDAVVDGVRTICDPFIGEPNDLGSHYAMRNAIRSFLDGVAESGAIASGENVGYSFSINSSAADSVLGVVRVDLTLRPALQIQSINVTVNLVPPTGISS